MGTLSMGIVPMGSAEQQHAGAEFSAQPKR